MRQKAADVKAYVEKKSIELKHMTAKEVVNDAKNKLFSLDDFNAANRAVLLKALAGEFLVTTLFLFIVCAVSINVERSGHAESESMVVGALATGFCSIALIYSFADVSGAHFNPAVTFATLVSGKMSTAKGLAYMGVQLLASLIAVAMLSISFPPLPDPNNAGTYASVASQLVVRPSADVNIARAFFMEIILSFILSYVIFATAFDTVGETAVKVVDDSGKEVKGAAKSSRMTIYTTSGPTKAGFAPLSIGLTLGFLCFLGGSVSGGAFNPARVFGPGLCSWTWDYMWLYWIGDFTGAGLAGIVQQRFFATAKKN